MSQHLGRRCAGGQSGFGLLESLISLALTAVVVLGLAVGLLTSVRSSDLANSVQTADSALASFSESLRSMPYPEPPSPGACPTLGGPDGYVAAYGNYVDAWSAPGVSTELTAIEHWDPSTGDFGSTCPSFDPSVHRLTIGVSIDGEESSAQVVVGRQ